MKPAAALLQARVMYFVMLMSAGMYVVVGELVAQPRAEPSGPLFAVVAAVAASVAVAGTWMSRRLWAQAEEMFSTNPEGAVALARWRTSYLVGFCSAEAVMIFVLVLRFLGFELRKAAPFYAVGLALTVLTWPKPSISAAESFTARSRL